VKSTPNEAEGASRDAPYAYTGGAGAANGPTTPGASGDAPDEHYEPPVEDIDASACDDSVEINRVFVHPPMVISLAKREEEIYIQAKAAPVRLTRNNPALRILQAMRDEAHRFAQAYHHTLRRKRTFDEGVASGRRPPKGR
jgi:hypothetical protein